MSRLGLVAAAAAAAAAVLIAAPPLLGSGLPSFSRGVFHTATIGYYLETAVLLGHDGWWTRCWCSGFQDLVRFYPPLGNLLLAAVLRVTGSAGAASAAGMAAALAVLAAGVSMAAVEAAGPAAVPVALLSVLAAEAWVSTAAVYWEYTRLLGDGLALAALALLLRTLRLGGSRDAAKAGALAGLVVLTSLISAVWLAAAAAAVFLYTAREAARRAPYALPGLARLAAVYVAAAAAVSAWWLVPAAAPWGLGHYLRAGASLSEKLRVLSYSLSLSPPLWAPALQAPLLAAVAAALISSRRLGPAAWAAAAVAAAVLLYGQGLRLLPPLGVLLVLASLSSLEATPPARRRVLLALLAAVLVLYAARYYPTYSGLLRGDHSFLASDEYRAASWLEALARRGLHVRVYAMYGPRLHGNQWLNVFAPDVEQTLSGFMEGCLDARVFRLDYLVKDSLDYSSVYRLLRETCTGYLLVDRQWLRERPLNVVVLLERRGLVEPVAAVNRVLRYSSLYRVAGVGCGGESEKVEAVFWTPARVAGVAASLVAALVLRRLLAGEEAVERGVGRG